jgi:hypothetical protein
MISLASQNPMNFQLIESAVGAQFQLQPLRDTKQHLAYKPDCLLTRVNIARLQMREEQLPYLRPKSNQGSITTLTVVSIFDSLALLGVLLEDRTVQINGAGGYRQLLEHVLMGTLLNQPQRALQITHVSDLEAMEKLTCRPRCR